MAKKEPKKGGAADLRQRAEKMLPGRVPEARDSEGKVVGIIGINRDITERKQMVEAVRERDERLRLLVASSPDMMFFQDRQLRYRWVANLTPNFSREPVIGKTDFDLLPEPEAQQLVAAKSQVLETCAPFRGEFCSTRDGKPSYFDIALEPHRDGSGQVVGLFGYARDVTERRRLEEELRALSRRLVETQEEERRNIAHELHDQVSQYLAYLQILMDGAARSPTKSNVEEMQEALQEIVSAVRNLTLSLRPPMLDDLGLLPALLWYFERFTKETQVRVQFHHERLKTRLPPAVNIAAYRIIQGALLNVVSHAGVSEVTVNAWGDKKALNISIEDKGVGFDPAALPIGAAVGLSGMRERARSLGGSLTIETGPGAGARVSTVLPLSAPQRDLYSQGR